MVPRVLIESPQLHGPDESFQHWLGGHRVPIGSLPPTAAMMLSQFLGPRALTVRPTFVDTNGLHTHLSAIPSNSQPRLTGRFDCQIAIRLAILEAFDSAASTRARV